MLDRPGGGVTVISSTSLKKPRVAATSGVRMFTWSMPMTAMGLSFASFSGSGSAFSRGRPDRAVDKAGPHHQPVDDHARQGERSRQQIEIHIADTFDQRARRGAGEEAPDDCRRSGQERELRRSERSEEHTSELQSLMRISYAVFRLKKKNI